jgi:hypothetical protein
MLALVDPIALPDDPAVLAEEIARTAAHLDAATHRLLTCIRQFDASGEWQRQGALSCAHWLAWRIGLDAGAAREKVRVARALGSLPHIDGGLRRGVLSYAKVRALTRVATPDNDACLAEMGREATGAQLERLCRQLRKVVNATREGECLDDRRHVRDETLANGMVRISAVLHPDEAALVMKAIEEARRRSAGDASAETPGQIPPRPDALVTVAQAFLDLTESPSPLADPRTQLLVHLDQDPLASDGTLAATLDDGTRVSAETLRRLGCDATVVPIRHGEGTHSAGRRTRTVSPNLRLALWLRDRGCRFPSCSNQLFLHAHHIRHWIHGGATTAENLVLLCSTHHRLVHEGLADIQVRGGEVSFFDRHRRCLEAAPRAATVEGDATAIIEAWNEELEIEAESNLPGWNGERLDLDWAAEALGR